MSKLIPCSQKWIDDEDVAEVSQALRSGSQAEARLAAYEEAFAAQFGARYAVAISGGMAAMRLACLAAGLGPGSETITTPICAHTAPSAIVLSGSQPVFADVCPDTVNLVPETVSSRLTARTAAILPTHFAGHACDMPALRALADRKRLTVIEDGSLAPGARTPDTTVGDCRFSDMTVFSASPNEIISLGGGGVITTNNPDLHRRLVRLRSSGLTRVPPTLGQTEGDWYAEMQMLGYDCQPGDLQCALGNSQLKKLETCVTRNRKIALRYNKAFASLPGVSLSQERPGHRAAWSLYTLRFEGLNMTDRRWIYDTLRAARIGTEVHYVPMHWQAYYRDRFHYAPGLCPNAECHYRETISLPLHPTLTDAEIAHVIQAVRQVAFDLTKRLSYAA